ncbi:MAG: DUF438 domain-containing protein [Lachnospiraceae bacterium]|nr:DUF438 domain-containing protein [Lachnospiraceae bacterium]
MSKKIDFTKSVYELTQENPEIVGIMARLGFTEITKKAMLNSVGKLMTVPKGAKMKGIPMEEIIRAFEEKGFKISGADAAKTDDAHAAKPENDAAKVETASPDERTEQLKGYLKRVSAGESLERVRSDFAREFGEVEASEIMKAEQGLMAEGMPLTEVQKLCDLHSALFHGATKEERIANAEKEVAASLAREREALKEQAKNKEAQAKELEQITGHPLYTFTKENEELRKLLVAIKPKLATKEDVTELFTKIREVSVHYAKKGDLLYPLLNVKYDISGPSNVMWTVDDEIRDEMSALEKETERGEWWMTRLESILTRADEMIYKEQNILFPICADNFSEEEWKGIYRDSKDYAACFGVENERWEDGESIPALNAAAGTDGEIVMPGGHMKLNELTAMLNTIPLELSFVDAENINRYFNEGPKVFKRPGMAIDREVFSCHPPKIEPMVRGIIDDFRAGKRDCVPVWMEKMGKTFLVTYYAVRDKNGTYLGTLEAVQDMEFAKEHFLG